MIRDQLLTLEEVAERLHTSRRHVYMLCQRGIIPTVAVGRRVRIDPDRLEEFIRTGGRKIEGQKTVGAAGV